MTVNNQQTIFKDRRDAGKKLAEALAGYRNKEVVVFAIPRGGIPVAAEVATGLQCALDIVIVRKIPVPGDPEAGYGAITEDGTLVLNEPMVKRLNLGLEEIARQSEAVRDEIMHRSMIYRRKISPHPVKGRIAIIIDDGLASGYTMLAAVQSLRKRKSSQVVVAVPVSSGSAYDLVKPAVEDLVSIIVAKISWFAVADYYQNWRDLNDEEVSQYLDVWRQKTATELT